MISAALEERPAPVIEIDGLWKKFRVYHSRTPGLRDRVLLFGKQKTEDFWALRDVTLRIERGSTVGLIGRNGSGKSTLLKVISRILYPDRGQVRVSGRLSTLLELGAGFHPDFTGRENIYLNASILGLSRNEIRNRLDEIVTFSELGDFIDNPVRSYSSGMYMRLGFSVAVHVDREVLMVDEVLAVGDMAFQEKCMAKIKLLQRQGTTIVLVSHAPRQVEELCDAAVWLDQGEVRLAGDASSVSRGYVEFLGRSSGDLGR